MKNKLRSKKIVLSIFIFILGPIIFLVHMEKIFSTREWIFYFFATFLSLFPGKSGSYLRLAYYKYTLVACTSEAFIGFGTFFTHRTSKLGRNVNIGNYCLLGSADIGENAMIASRVSLLSGKNSHFSVDGIISRKPTFTQISIGKDTWIGEGAIIMDDIGNNCIVSAGSVVARKMPDNVTIVGNPARPVKNVSINSNSDNI